MINSLRIRNFKAIRRADIGLERLTVIVGPNASGKTSILEGLHCLSRLGTDEPNDIFQGKRDPVLILSRSAIGEEIELSCSAMREGVRIRLSPPPDLPRDSLYSSPTSDEWLFSVEGKEETETRGDWRPIGEIPSVVRLFRPSELLRLDPSRMAETSSHVGTRVAADGSGLPSVLAFMALNRPDDFQIIQQRLRAVVPTIERIRFDRTSFRPAASRPRNSSDRHSIVVYGNDTKISFDEKRKIVIAESVGETIVFDFNGARDVPAHSASEGTILVLGLLTVLMSQGRPDLILLDDIDRGLHPKAQREVVGLLRTILDQNPELQIVATTHSPYLLDHLRPEEVRLTTLGDDGTVSVAGLTDHPDFDKWKDEMAPGEMWSLFGEKWVGELPKNLETK